MSKKIVNCFIQLLLFALFSSSVQVLAAPCWYEAWSEYANRCGYSILSYTESQVASRSDFYEFNSFVDIHDGLFNEDFISHVRERTASARELNYVRRYKVIGFDHNRNRRVLALGIVDRSDALNLIRALKNLGR